MLTMSWPLYPKDYSSPVTTLERNWVLPSKYDSHSNWPFQQIMTPIDHSNKLWPLLIIPTNCDPYWSFQQIVTPNWSFQQIVTHIDHSNRLWPLFTIVICILPNIFSCSVRKQGTTFMEMHFICKHEFQDKAIT